MDKAKEQYIQTIGRQLLREIFVQESKTARDEVPRAFEEKVQYLKSKSGQEASLVLKFITQVAVQLQLKQFNFS